MSNTDEPSPASAGSQPVAWGNEDDDGIYEVGLSEAQAHYILERAASGKYWHRNPRIVPLYRSPQPAITDKEREAVGRAAMLIDDTVIDDSDLALNDYQALRGLYERTKEAANMSDTDERSVASLGPPRPVVYIASPYTVGDPAMNTHFQCRVFHRLMDDGIVWPVVPLWSHFQHQLFPRRYQDWIAYDLAMLERYDACIRLAAELPELGYQVTESSGADGEVAAFRRMGRPVFFSVEECYEWAAARPFC